MKIRSLLVTAFVGVASFLAFAAAPGSGGPSGASTSAIAPAALGTLTYSGFAGTCSAAGFATSAVTGATTFPFAVAVNAATTLNGAAYDTYTLSLASPFVFPSFFRETFAAPLASNTYTFVFALTVTMNGLPQGVSTTTINCTAGTFSATNVWQAAVAPVVPATSPAALWALGLLLAAAAVWRLRRA